MNQIYFKIKGWGAGWLDNSPTPGSRFIHLKCLAPTKDYLCMNCGEGIPPLVLKDIVKFWLWATPEKIKE